MNDNIKIWAAQVRAPFLLLAVVLVLVGGGLAHNDGRFMLTPFLLCLAGAVLSHISVNLFNELSDYRTGIDAMTRRTPFSGGSGNLQSGLTTESSVRAAAWGTLAAAAVIGIYLSIYAGWLLVFFIAVGGLVTIFYTGKLARLALGELFAGLCLGSMVVAGTYIAITGKLTPHVLLASIVPGVLTSLLLFLNEFPDLEADRAGGRRHLLILFGRGRSAIIYAASLAACFTFIVYGAFANWFPLTVLLTFIVLPMAVKAAITTMKHHDDFEKMIPALGANVGVVLGVDFFLALAYFIH